MEMIAFACRALEELEVYAATSGSGTVAVTEALRNDLEGDWAQDARPTIQQFIDSVGAPLTRANARALITPLLRQAALAIEYPNPGGPISEIWEALYDYCVANSQSINDSEDTHDTSWSAGGSNVGNGTVVRLTVDENGEVLGGWLPDTWTLTCEADARTQGEANREEWILEGTAGRSDNLVTSGGTNYIQTEITTKSAGDTDVVKNPSFNVYTLSGADIATLSGWTQTTGGALSTNLSINTTYTQGTTPGDTSEASLQFDGDEGVYQDLVATQGATFNPDAPYLIDVGIAKVGTPTGTFTLRLSGTLGSGGVSNTLAHTSMTGSGTFDRLRIAIGQNCWPKNFNANDLKLQISLGSSGSIDASNYFVVDDIVFTEMDRIGRRGDPREGRGAMGQYIAILRGATPFVKGDTFTATDAIGGTRGVNHWALSKIAQFGYLPLQTGGTETIADK